MSAARTTRSTAAAKLVVTAALGVVAALGALTAGEGAAAAYPQFQLSRDQTCTGCHVSPAGGGLLRENGFSVAEQMSQWGTAPEFFYNKLPTPSWLELGGDVRGASGYSQTPEKVLATFPMQAELYGYLTLGGGFSFYADLGARTTETGKENETFAWSREHYVMWQPKEGEATGLFVRAGRFMPVFGIRQAEHLDYTREFGGTPLYGETYGLAVEYVDPAWEVHATGFLKDPLLDTVQHDNGASIMGEYRLTQQLSVGAEAMATKSDDDKKYRVGVLGKLYVPDADTLLLFEGQFVNQLIEPRGAPLQIVSYLLASRPLASAFLVDLGLGYFNENLHITELHREAIDLNVHWFATSHLELLFTGRFETLAFGSGGPSDGYALIQVHYRL